MLLYLPWHLRFASSTPLFAYSELRLLRLMTLNGWLEREPVLNATGESRCLPRWTVDTLAALSGN